MSIDNKKNNDSQDEFNKKLENELEEYIEIDDVDDFFSKMEKKRKARLAKMNFFQRKWDAFDKVCNSFGWKVSGLKSNIRGKYQILTKGYSDNEWWDYAYHNSKKAVILLTKLRNSKWLGCPGDWGCKECLNYEASRPADWDCGCDKFGRWKKAIDDMIFYHSCVAGQYEETTEKYGKISKECYTDIDNLENKKRFLKGRMLYSRYYQALWD